MYHTRKTNTHSHKYTQVHVLFQIQFKGDAKSTHHHTKYHEKQKTNLQTYTQTHANARKSQVLTWLMINNDL